MRCGFSAEGSGDLLAFVLEVGEVVAIGFGTLLHGVELFGGVGIEGYDANVAVFEFTSELDEASFIRLGAWAVIAQEDDEDGFGVL